MTAVAAVEGSVSSELSHFQQTKKTDLKPEVSHLLFSFYLSLYLKALDPKPYGQAL